MVHLSKFRLFIVSTILLVTAGCANKKTKITSLQNAVSTNQTVAETYDSGKDRVIKITSQIQHDVVPAIAHPIEYAQVKNIDQDLNIVKIAEYFNCKTVMGNAFLVETLKAPISPHDTTGIIARRQAAIAGLVNNPKLKKEIDKILNLAAEQEQEIIKLMSDYFIGKTCPELAQLALLKEQKSGMYSFASFCNTNSGMKTAATVLNVLGLIFMPAASIALGITAYNNAQIGIAYGDLAFWSGYFGVLTGVYGYIVYDDFSKAGEKRKKIHALNQLIHVAENIEQLCAKYKIENQFKLSLIEDKQGVQLIKESKHSRYKNKKNYCFHTAGVHTFLYKIYQNDKHFAQMFASIAEMDAYNAIATKMLEGQGTDHKFCFAQTITADKPVVTSVSFWNVLVKNPVVNSINMNQHVILTGPNAGGKTTSIRAILQNIVLAQTYGIAAAEQFLYTQFDIIYSYLNISDDIVRGDSLFASEIKRAQDIMQTVKNLLSTQKMFFALDELFTGTAAEQGEKCAYEFIKKTATFDHALFIYATHFNKLKDLGNQNIGLMNYKVDAPIKNSDGKLVYPYTLSTGASTVNVAEDMAKEAGLFE